MEKKLKVNFILKGIAVFAFVAFCLLAILAGVTLPFVSNASTADSAVVNDNSYSNDCAVASAQTQNLVPGLNYNLPDYIKTVKKYNQLTDNEAIYGIAFNESDIADFWSIACTSAYSGYSGNTFILPCGFKLDNIDWFLEMTCNFSDATRVKFEFMAVKSDNSDSALLNQWTWFPNPYSNLDNPPVSFCLNYFLAPKCFYSSTHSPATAAFFPAFTDKMLDSMYFITEINSGSSDLENQIAALQVQLTEKQNQIDTLIAEKNALQAQLTEKQNQIDTLTSEKNALQAQLTEKQNQIDTLTAEKNALQTQLSNMNFLSHFGNFDTLASSDFYVNLSSDIVLPEIFYQYTNNLTPVNGWFLMGRGANMEIYGLNLFDRFYYNGTHEYGFLNCGFQLNIKSIPSTTMPPTYTNECTLDFVVYDTLVWSADCDIDYNIDTKVETITNIRNGSFKVTANYDKDTNVYQFTVPDNKLFLLNENYNKAYDNFRSYVVQQDYKKTKIPSDNALYLNGYQAASKDFYNNGYNDGVAAGEKSGYNKGFTAGDAQGYNRGVEVGGNYSFLSLFGAIFDAPIQAIFGGTTTLPAGTTITDKNGNTTTLLSSATVKRAGLLNFDIMGVNLSGFVLALFSLSILVVVIKFALGKGR